MLWEDNGPRTLQGLTAKICASSSSGPVLTNCLGSLTIPALQGAGSRLYSFSAGSGGIDLNANTEYYLFLDGAATVRRVLVRRTASAALDAGAAAGWSIPQKLFLRSRDQSPPPDWDPASSIARFQVHGYANPVPTPTAAPPNPDPSNLARGAVQWDPVGAMHGLPTRMSEIRSNKPSEPTGSVDLASIAASVREEIQRHSRGFYLTTQVFGLGERSHLVRAGPNGSRYIVDADGQRHEVARPGSLLLVKIWHVYYRSGRGHNTIELLGDTFLPRRDNRLTEPVEICLPAPAMHAERVRIAVRGRLDPHWTILDTAVEDGQVCTETVRVAWVVLVYAPEPEAA